jgi:hypothetical protein
MAARLRVGSSPDADPEEYALLEYQLARKRDTWIAVVLALILTFGTAHMFARAWKRGFALAVTEIAGFVLLFQQGRQGELGGLLIAGCIMFDALGAVYRVRSRRPPPSLPVMRIHR